MKTRGMKRQVSGIIISNKMDKTVVVEVERLVKHPSAAVTSSRRMTQKTPAALVIA